MLKFTSKPFLFVMKKYSFLPFLALFLLFGAAAVFAQQAENKPLTILEKPVPELPYNHAVQTYQGNVQLNVEFLSYNEIGQIVPVTKDVPPSVMQGAIDAAKNIKFEAEIKDGVPATNYRVIDYYYSWNGGWKKENAVAPDRNTSPQLEKAEGILKRAVEKLGGDKYMQVKTVYSKGIFSLFKDGVSNTFSSFTDIIVFPDKERTDFKQGGYKNVQSNNGDTGWLYGEDTRAITNQTSEQVANFKRDFKTSVDYLLRGSWRTDGAKLSYVGRREASLGRRNEVVRLTFKDEFWVEYEFTSHDGLPSKAVYERKGSDGETGKQEDRYAQFVDIQGIKAPYIIDRFRNGKQTSRVNYQSVEFNKVIPASIFIKPADLKEAKREIKL